MKYETATKNTIKFTTRPADPNGKIKTNAKVEVNEGANYVMEVHWY